MDVNSNFLNSNVDGCAQVHSHSLLCWLRVMVHKVLKQRVQRCSLGKHFLLKMCDLVTALMFTSL